jgi:2',3'-cyclic-nucleotide 2'-phosphodiesterase (5'-nucleotidase family)
MKRLLLACLLVPFCAADVPAAAPRPVTITFYHTSDLHEHSENLPRIAAFVEARRREGGHVLFVDTGDWCNKGDLTELNTRGEAIVEMMGASGYDAVIPGNHDYSHGTKRLAELVDRHAIPLLAANCTWPEDARPKRAAPYRIHAFDGVKVAIIGTATPNLGDALDKRLQIRPVEPAVRKVLDALAGKADIVVLMTHLGPPTDQKLAKALPRVDILFGGHHHKRFKSLNFDAGSRTVIQHSGCFGDHVGEVTVTWDGGRITDRRARLVAITRDMPPSPKVKAIAERYRARGAATPAAPAGRR